MPFSKRHILFLRDLVVYTFTAFGGAQAHIGIMLRDFVQKRRYISEEELLELNALTQILPGPASTQTLVGMAYKVGGFWLAIISFIIWVLPSAAIMCFAAISLSLYSSKAQFEHTFALLQPVAIGIVAFAAFQLGKKILKSDVSMYLAVGAAITTLILNNTYVFPILILVGGIVSSALESSADESQLRSTLFSNINTRKVLYFVGVLLLFAALGALINRTSPFSLPIRLFENFYRNGIFVFGGGQVLVPFMFTEFVEMKHYLSSSEFLSGFALQQALPGPTFSFTSFIGALTLKNAGYGLWSQIGGSFIAVLGINLPGLILILFIVPFWSDLKKIGRIKHSLSGINAVSVGFLLAAVIFMFRAQSFQWQSLCLVFGTFVLLSFTRIKTPILIFAVVAFSYFL